VTIVPAIDLRGGRCVRLLHGDPERETRYDDDPVARARAFAAAGATRLHVVDLDGALGTGENASALRAICAAVEIPVQSGGGLRSVAAVEERFAAGAQWAVLGTMLVEEPELARALVTDYGPRIVAGVDARGPEVAVRGWRRNSGIPRDALVRDLSSWGFERIVFTEIARDGAGNGFDVGALRHVAGLAPLKVTASGGARMLDDLLVLAAMVPPNVDSAIVGRALYEGTLDLADAIATVASLGSSAT
jgi:phosphoribosylformimino-5-aminoimidazole carboxamide ribotide isomerase